MSFVPLDQITALNAGIDLMDFMLDRENPKARAAYEASAGVPIDLTTLHLMHPSVEFIYDTADNPPSLDGVKLTFGRWSFAIYLNPPYPHKQALAPDSFTVTVIAKFNEILSGRAWNLDYDRAKNEITYNRNYTRRDLAQLLSQGMRNKVSAVLRGRDEYLKNAALYDTLQQSFNIKTKKKK